MILPLAMDAITATVMSVGSGGSTRVDEGKSSSGYVNAQIVDAWVVVIVCATKGRARSMRIWI
jgi:hypothetical protein